MKDKRSREDRRSGKDRRKAGKAPHNGPERRGLKFRRSDTDRRNKKRQ